LGSRVASRRTVTIVPAFLRPRGRRSAPGESGIAGLACTLLDSAVANPASGKMRELHTHKGAGIACLGVIRRDPCKGAIRRGGRVAEGARLESVFTGNRNVGSNPTPSATLTFDGLR
jgi:hypothetical protein